MECISEQQYLVQVVLVPPKSKLPCGPARLHLQDYSFSLVSGVPPKLLGIWPIKELRRFGVVDGKFCFEGGSHCGKGKNLMTSRQLWLNQSFAGKGLHILHTNQTEELMRAFDLASQGRLHGKRKATLHKNSCKYASPYLLDRNNGIYLTELIYSCSLLISFSHWRIIADVFAAVEVQP